MVCARIITVSLLSLNLSWASLTWAQNGHSSQQQSGTTLAERLASLRDSFRKDDTKSSESSSSNSNRKLSKSPGSRSRSNNNRENRSRQQKTSAKTAKTILPKIQVGDLIPGGLFTTVNRNSQSDATRQSPRNRNPITQNRGDISRDQPRQASKQTRSVRVARSSPDYGSRRDELESALSELMEPRVNIDVESPSITPPQADSSEPFPGFFGGASKSIERIPTQSKPTRIVSEPKAPKSKASVQTNSLDLRRALLDGAVEDESSSQTTSVAVPMDDNTKDNIAAGPELAFPAVDEPISESISDEIKVEQPQRSGNAVTIERNSPDLTTDENALRSAQDAFSNGKATTIPILDSPVMSDLENKPENSETADGVVFADDSPVGETLLFSYQQPVIVSHIEGTRKILVGREAKFRVVLRNKSDTAANALTTSIRIPAWAEVIDATSSRGIIQRADATGNDGIDGNTLQWRMRQLDARSTQTLDLRLVPHSGRALKLGVSWSHAPVGSETIVEVQEPKLQITIAGASDVLFGKPERYRLTLSNPGTGVAEKVLIKLLPPGGDASSETQHRIGSLQPGATKVIDLELTPREAGELQVKATAIAAGDLHADTIKHVFCRKPELEIDWRGPETKYAGTVSTYYFRVRNPGTAPTDPLELKLQLPAGVSYVAASEGESFDEKHNTVYWKLAGLSPNEEQFMRVRCRLDKPGAKAMQLSAQTATSDLRDAKTIETNVVALADLKLNVSDPQGPIPVGEAATYEIRVTNRGTSTAQGVNIVALFSEGIDPIAVEGAQYTINDGRVSFRAIKSLPAGREVVLKIRAKATQPGVHVFRTEVVCQDLDIKLLAEETTRFFKDDFRWTDGESPYSVERTSLRTPASK